MATIRQLPSGNWQALVYVKGERIPFTDNSKTVVEAWADEQEKAKQKGRFRDPRRGRITLTAWHDIWKSQRVAEPNTTEREDSTWRVWVEPRYGDWTLEELEQSREDMLSWVREMIDAKVGPWTILNVVKLLSKMFGDAVDCSRMERNPALRLKVPTPPKKPPFFWTSTEAKAIVRAAPAPYDLFIEYDMHVGPRIEEMAGLLVDCVDVRLGLIHIVRVAVNGVLREYPKTSKSHRTVPLLDHLIDPFARQIYGRSGSDAVFPSPSGHLLSDVNFRNRVFKPAIERARMCACDLVDADGKRVLCDVAEHKVRPGSPNDMRHTAASWAVMGGTPLYEVQQLLGHEKQSTTEIYAHLDPSKHAAVRAVWGKEGLTGALRRAEGVHEALISAPVPAEATGRVVHDPCTPGTRQQWT